MRVITVPESVQFNILGKQWTFATCIEHVIDGAPRFNNSGPGIRAGARIIEAIGEGVPGSNVVLRDDDWKSLSEEMETPVAGYYPPLFVLKADGTQGASVNVPCRLLLPYIDAVAQAQHAPSV